MNQLGYLVKFLVIILLVSGCNSKKELKPNAESSERVYKKPIEFLLDSMPAAKRVDLKTVTPPLVVSAGSGGFNSKALPAQGHFTNFNTDDGLVMGLVTCGLEDSRGQLWFGTAGGGVSRFDGAKFTNFSVKQGLVHVSARCMLEDKKGNIWIGTSGGGVSRYDGTRFFNMTTADGLPENYILSMIEDSKGNLWFGTQKGVISRYDGKTFTTFDSSHGLPQKSVNAIMEDKKGTLWFATFGGGVARHESKENNVFTVLTSKNGLANDNVWCITEDTNGNIWFGTQDGGVSRYDGTSFSTFTTDHGLGANNIHSIKTDRSGKLWAGTQGGLSLFNGTAFIPIVPEQVLSGSWINCITEDKNGNLWLGTDGSGINRFNGSSFSIFTSNQELAKNNIFNITEDKRGNIWFAPFGDGVYRFDGISLTNFTTTHGLANNIVMSIGNDSKGNIWFGTYEGGVSRFDGNSFTTFTSEHGLASNSLWDIIEDKKGNLWFATHGGISCFDGKGFTSYTTEQGLAHYMVKNILEDDKGNIWCCTEGGISRFDGKRFTNFTVEQGLVYNNIMSLLKDRRGNLWFGSEGYGVSRYDGSGFISFSTKDGLADDYVYDMVEDTAGVIWMGTNKGLSGLKFKTKGDEKMEIKGAGLFRETNEKLKTLEPVWEIYNDKTGFPVKDINQGAMCITKLGLPSGDKKEVGLIWGACGDHKVIRFDPSSVKRNNENSLPFLRKIKINETSLNWYSLGINRADSTLTAQQEAMVYEKPLTAIVRDSLQSKFSNIDFDSVSSYYQIPVNLKLPYKFNHLTFDFGSTETTRSSMVRYQYMLEGYDKEWSPVTENSYASFGNISEGNYIFKLKARSPEGEWSEPLSYSFKILPPWWRTWWAYSAYVLSFFITMYAVFRWRTRSLKTEKIRLEEKVLQRTVELERKSGELTQSLENLRSTQALLIQSEKMASLGELTAGIAHEIQNPLNFVNNFSEVSTELVDEMNVEIENGNNNEAKMIAIELKENLGKINHHGKRAGAIVKGMLQHSRTGSGVKEPTDLNKLADEYLRLAYHGLRAKDKSFETKLETFYDDSIGIIQVIPQEMGRAFLNLVTNAFYAVTEKKKDQPGYEPLVSVTTEKQGNKVLIKVKDNGKGIPKHVVDKIFQPFFTTKPTGQGTGLGLSLSYDIVKAHGGELKVNTKEGVGAEFIIQLPAV